LIHHYFLAEDLLVDYFLILQFRKHYFLFLDLLHLILLLNLDFHLYNFVVDLLLLLHL
jgi:hypothetical protein